MNERKVRLEEPSECKVNTEGRQDREGEWKVLVGEEWRSLERKARLLWSPQAEVTVREALVAQDRAASVSLHGESRSGAR